MTDAALAIDCDTSIDDAVAVVRDWVSSTLPEAWVEAADRGGLLELRKVRSRADYEDWYPIFADSGLVAPHWPREYGGLGLPMKTIRAVEEVLAPYNLGRLNILGINLAGTTLLEWGTDEQKARFLAPIVRNEEKWCQMFSEPGAGSDLPSLACRAERDGDIWNVTGQKVWSTWAQNSDMGLLLARTDPAVPKREGITYFAIDLHQPGVDVRPLRMINGDSEFNEVFLDGATVPDAWRIGPVGDGWSVARTTLSGERMMISGAGSGAGVDNLGGRSVDRLIERARSMADDGRSGWADDRVRQELMTLWSQKQTIQWTNLRARANRRAGRPPGPESSTGKLLQTNHNMALQEAWVNLVGLRAVAREGSDDDSDRLIYGFLRSRANSIEGGTTEVQKNTLGERVLGLPKEPDPWHGKPWGEVPRS
jgi:alkylation response protein AidB-like acyl-CoA dehydrogenase